MGSLRRVFKKFRLKLIFNVALIMFSFLVLSFSAYNLAYSGSIFPNISVAGTPVSNLDQNTASELLSQKFLLPTTIKLVNQNQSFDLSVKDVDFSYDYRASANKAFDLVRTGNLTDDFIGRIKLLFYPINLMLTTKYDDGKLAKFISVVGGQDSRDPVNPTIKIVNGAAIVTKGSTGTEVDQDLLKQKILDELSNGSTDDITIPVNVIDNTLSDDEAAAAKARAEKYLGKKIVINFEFSSFNVKDADIISLLNPKGGFNSQKIQDYLSKITAQIDRDPQNPKFAFQGEGSPNSSRPKTG